MKAPRTTLLVALASVLAGCVTETARPGTRGVPYRPAGSPSGAAGKAAPAQAELPAGPIATPVMDNATLSTRVQVEVVPLGVLTYDGATLPLVAPDGRFLAVQEGEAPSWEAILAEPAAETPGSRLVVYQVQDRELKRVPPASPIPPGLLLGRSADEAGFLVEAPRPDGARWIGHVSWATGTLKWLVQGEQVSAHAILTSNGELAFTRRAVESNAAELVLRTPGGVESVRSPEDGTFAFPMSSGDADVIYALLASRNGISLEAFRVSRSQDQPPRLGTPLAGRGMLPSGDALTAFQIASTAHPALPHRASTSPALALFHPRLGRMAEFSLETAAFTPLAPRSIAAAADLGAPRPAYYCTTPDGLVYYQVGRGSELDGAGVRILSSPYVPRRVLGEPESLFLLGPVKGRPDQMEVVRMFTRPAQPTPPRQ
jgi:hypothetical protein